ncbi:MAG TPA: TIGR02391 family protein [Sphingomicrobium sp.]|nr:TIGR02391 family protein [Sphingomicrobium sp.]
MKDLIRAIPDPQIVLAMAPEELAEKLLFLLKLRLASAQPRKTDFHLPNLIGELQDVLNSPTYGAKGPVVAQAAAEAFAWLQGQALIVPKPGEAYYGHFVISRRAEAMTDEADFARYRLGISLPRDLLHPSIAERVWTSFTRGEYDIAVLQAMRQVEIEVREASGLSDLLGMKLMREAFRPNEEKSGKVGKLTAKERDGGEQDAMMQLFAGAIGALKNPPVHRAVRYESPAEAAAIVIFASELLRIVDDRKVFNELTS